MPTNRPKMPSTPVRVSKLCKSGALLGYGDHKISDVNGSVWVHFADGTNVPCESVMEARWAITQEVWMHQLFLDQEDYCRKNGLPVPTR